MKLALTLRQDEFARAVLSGEYDYLCFGGGIRGGKSYVAISMLVLLSYSYPGSRWAIVRKDLPTLRKNTIPTFDKIAHPFFGPVNRTEWRSVAANGSEILFFPESLKDDPDLNRWKGLEVNGWVLEEANELSRDSFSKAQERGGSWNIAGVGIGDQPKPVIMLTCNPAQGWVKDLFYTPHSLGTLRAPFYFLQSLITDNPHLSPRYLAQLENMKLTNEIAYRRFVKGDWNVSDDPTQLIKFEWIEAARNNVEPVAGKKGLGVDVARYGHDDTVLCAIEGNRVVSIERFHGNDLYRVADLVMAKINEGPIDAPRVCIDVCGVGAGPYDILQRHGFRVTPIDSGRKAEGEELDKPIEQRQTAFAFKNRRAQIWWGAREKLRLGQICLEAQDPKLAEDLTAVRYSISGDKTIAIESKEDTKARIGRSPDAGDAFVYALAQPAALNWAAPGAVQTVSRFPTKTIIVNSDQWDTDAEDFKFKKSNRGGLF